MDDALLSESQIPNTGVRRGICYEEARLTRGWKTLGWALCRIAGTVTVVVLIMGWFIAQPVLRSGNPSKAVVDSARLRAHVEMLSMTLHPRDWTHPDNLDRCASYIEEQFAAAGAEVERQVFTVRGRPYCNVIGRLGAGRGSKLVVGAHYDAYADHPGADDNASGVAALLELAGLLGRHEPGREVELVGYVLEEPPFFGTELMGSAVHARRLAENGEALAGVIVFEMVGYFSDERGSQSYPMLLLRLLYPSRGNFIAVASRWDQGDWIRTVKAGMKGTTDLPVYSIRAPVAVPGIDFSDHMNYWPHGYNALMITDTAFYRNKAYHQAGDTADRLDYDRMAQVVVATFEAVRSVPAAE